MSRLDDLIRELCPDGVEYKKIKDCFKRLKGTPITAGKMKEIENENGEIRVFAGGKTLINAREDDIPKANITRVPAVLVQSRGVIDVIYFESPFTFKNEMWAYTHDKKTTVKYLYYILKNNIQQFRDSASGMGSLPQISLPVTNEFLIPLPPLPVQREIVRILDNFMELTTELTAELIARKKQYEYYRDNLLTFGDKEFEWKTLGAIINLSRGVRVVRSQLNSQGKYPVYQNSMIPLGYFNQSNCQAQMTFIISAGAAGSVGYSDVEFWAADDCYCLVCPENLDSRYLYHALMNQQEYIFSQVRKASVPRIGRDVVNRIKIPIPYPNEIDKSLKEQQCIVGILDRFDIICNDISSGLPAEIEARQKQYEHYRNELLTFKILKTEV